MVDEGSREIFLDAYTNLSDTHPSFTSRFKPTRDVGPWPLELHVPPAWMD